MLFSVLVPIYNVESYLQKCLDSIVCQKYDDYEIILVDDGSTDNSGRICDEYQAKYPGMIQVIHKPNEGLISARRIGIDKAMGDYCVFVDSDDYVADNLLVSLSDYIRRSQVDIVLYSFTYFNDNKIGKSKNPIAEDGKIWTGEAKKELYELLATSPIIDAMFLKAIKTTLLKDDPTDYTLYYRMNMSEDTLQSIYPMTAAKSIGYLDKSLYFYRYNPQSISRNFSADTIAKKNTNHVYEKIMEYLPKWGLNTKDFICRVNARWFNEALYLFCKSYENSKDRSSKRTIISFELDSMIPETNVDSYAKYVDPIYFRVYGWYKKSKRIRIKAFFVKRGLYQKYKNTRKR